MSNWQKLSQLSAELWIFELRYLWAEISALRVVKIIMPQTLFGVPFLNWDMAPFWVQFAWLELFLRARFCVFYSAWTLSDPPVGVTILDTSGLKFKQCSFGWWDHCLATGEFLFLMWGIKVSYNFSLLKSSCQFLSRFKVSLSRCVSMFGKPAPSSTKPDSSDTPSTTLQLLTWQC